jgi:hypothetical protein
MTDMPVISSTAAVPSFASLPASSVMLTMDQDGANVRIDWAEVEKQAQGSDAYLRCIALALIAVRDKNYQTIGHQ